MTVTHTLISLLRQQIETHSTVVWYDPKRAYTDLAQNLSAELGLGTTLQRYDPARGFIGLRYDLEPLWTGSTIPPRLLIYVPLARSASQQALVEYEFAGVILGPGQQPPERNTDLAAIARQALAPVFPPAKVEKIVGEVEAGQWTVAGLDQLIEKGDDLTAGVLTDIFGNGSVTDVVTGFLARPDLDPTIEKRQAMANLAEFLSNALSVPFSTGHGLTGLRAQLARQLLLTDLLVALDEHTPAALKTFSLAAQPVARQVTVQLTQTWRNRRDLVGSYLHWAEKVQTEIGLGSLDLPLEALAKTETFAGSEIRLQVAVAKALLKRATAGLVELAEARRDGFWSTQQPGLKTHWEVIVAGGRILVEATRIENSLKGKTWSAETLLSHYALADQPWCALDTAQRHLERDFHRFDFDQQQHPSLHELVAHARQRYSAVANDLAERFTHAFEVEKFELKNVLLQTDIYHEMVAPLAKTGRVAYILVDALRFETARELLTVLEPDWKGDLTLALATPPTITEIGMAALLPGAEKGLAIVSGESSKLAAGISGQTLKNRQERIDYFLQVVEGPATVAKLDQLAPLADANLRQSLKAARVVLVTATEEIDTLCETAPPLARRMLDDVLNQLRRGIKALFGLGIQRVIITADHGYLFGEKLTSGQGIDPPGGSKTAILKRRVWVGQGGAEVPGTIRQPLSAFGLGGALELVTPYNLSCFKVKGGATEYFHGGLSLPELVIPVLTVEAAVTPAREEASPIQWTLTPGSKTISTLFVSVTIAGQAKQLLPLQPPLVRLEVRAGGQPISTPISASYGFSPATRDVQLEVYPAASQTIAPNTVTLQITEMPSNNVAAIYLLDATTGVSLARLESIPVKITPF